MLCSKSYKMPHAAILQIFMLNNRNSEGWTINTKLNLKLLFGIIN